MRASLPIFSAVLAVALMGCGEDMSKKPTPSSTPSAANSTNSTYDNKTPATTTANQTAAHPSADNTAKNTRDDGSTVTPLDQGLSQADTAITAAVRTAVVAEPKLSVNAQNAKIITRDGVVTLRGPVTSSTERTTLMTIAERTPGVKRVDNQLEVVVQ
jgi:hyperosmotically inducible periplasmic protein